MSIYSKLNSLLTAANTKTGESDTTLTDAVQTLIDGYGQGGGGISIDGIVTGDEPIGAITITASTMAPANRERVFMNCKNITSVSAPSLTMIRSQMFAYCASLTSISFPELTSVNGSQHFISCTNLVDVYMPKLQTAGGNMLQGCTKLEIVDMPVLTSLAYTRMFYGCSKLQTLILRHTGGVVPVSNDAFTNTPFAGYGGLTGTLYVPSSLVASYKTASNWSTLYNDGTMTVGAIEGSIYE